MPVTVDRPSPYAPATGTLDIIGRYRTRGLQTPITADVLARAGISDSLISRVQQALVTLDLVDDEGRPTDTFEGLRLAPESEYKQRMQEWLRSAYAEVFTYVDPAVDDEVKIRDAFRTYKPVGQQSRMVTLFIGLCEAAGLRQPGQTERKPPSTASKKPASASAKSARTPKGGITKPKVDSNSAPGMLPAPLAGLLQTLPAGGQGWTKDQAEKFKITFGAVLDYCIPIVAETQTEEDEEDGGED